MLHLCVKNGSKQSALSINLVYNERSEKSSLHIMKNERVASYYVLAQNEKQENKEKFGKKD